MSETSTANPPSALSRRAVSSKESFAAHAGTRPRSGEPGNSGGAEDPTGTAESLVRELNNLRTGPRVFHLVVRFGDGAVPALERLVRGPSQAIYQSRCLAADALAAIGTPESVRALMHALRDCIDRELDPVSLEAEGVLVNHIAEHLSRFKTTQVTDALLAALRRRPYAYCAAALGLTGDPCAIPVLVACLFEDPVRPAAAAALRKFGRTALPWLMAAALERKTIGPTESPTRLLGRAAATELVGECMGSGDADVLTLLRRALNDPERSVQLEAARALARGPTADAQRAGAILAGALDDPDWKRVQTTANALAQLPNADRLIVDIIATRGNGDTDRRRRLRAVVLAGRLRLPAAVPRLRSLAAAADPKLRIAAICALGQIPTANSEAIARFLTDREPVIRWHALQILLRQHALTADCATPFLGDEDPEVRRLADASVREDLGAAVPALHRAALQFGAPLQGWSPRLRLWWHAWRLLAARAPVRRRDSR